MTLLENIPNVPALVVMLLLMTKVWPPDASRTT